MRLWLTSTLTTFCFSESLLIVLVGLSVSGKMLVLSGGGDGP